MMFVPGRNPLLATDEAGFAKCLNRKYVTIQDMILTVQVLTTPIDRVASLQIEINHIVLKLQY